MPWPTAVSTRGDGSCLSPSAIVVLEEWRLVCLELGGKGQAFLYRSVLQEYQTLMFILDMSASLFDAV